MMRICSFLPSATEILYALGLGESVAGITYECDYPPEARGKPMVVHTRLPRQSGAAAIDRQVSEFVARGESLYQVNREALQNIQPDLIITQDLCSVCAASPGDLDSALATLPHSPQVLSLNPRTLDEVWKDLCAVGQATGRGPQAEALVAELEQRVAAVEQAVAGEPPFVAGHWVPEMVACAGGTDVMGTIGRPSFRISWEEALGTQADVVVVMPCGYGLEQTVKEFKTTQLPAAWDELPAVRHRRGRLQLLLPSRTTPGHRN